MRVSRRSILIGVGVVGAASVISPRSLADDPALAVFDSRLPEAMAFAKAARVRGIRTVDIAAGDKAIWQLARQDLAVPGTVIGMTGWSEWVVLRGLLEEQGKRMKLEKRIAHRGKRIATPFEWAMT